MNIKRNVIILFLGLVFCQPMHANSHEYWSKVINAIIHVESKGDVNAISGSYVGPMQIAPILVEECNQILSEKKSQLRYTLDDRYNVYKCKEMFILFQEKYNPTKNVEWAIRAWNGGPKFKIKSTNSYYQKVLAAMK